MRGRSCPVRRTLLVLLLGASAGWSAELRTLKQETIAGESGQHLLQGNRPQGGVRRRDDADRSGADLTFGQQLGALPSNLPWVDVELTDGTVLHCATFSVKKDKDKSRPR